MIEEFGGGHKTSIEIAKQNVLARAGIVRFGGAEDAELLALLVSKRGRWLTGTVEAICINQIVPPTINGHWLLFRRQGCDRLPCLVSIGLFKVLTPLKKQ
jgi:hypothetical protein